MIKSSALAGMELGMARLAELDAFVNLLYKHKRSCNPMQLENLLADA